MAAETPSSSPDTRQLEDRWMEFAGKPRLHHLAGPSEPYVLSRWHVLVGETVRVGEILATIETNSCTLDFEVYDSGILVEQCFAVGEVIPDGAIIARIYLSDDCGKSALEVGQVILGQRCPGTPDG